MEHEKLSTLYTGSIASDYDSQRIRVPKWAAEQEVMRQILSTLPSGSRILDIPIGTGRFLEFYKEFGLHPTGMDISRDMLFQAEEKAIAQEINVSLAISDIKDIQAKADDFDCVLCIRLLNWLSAEDFRKALEELSRVSRKHIILGVRYYTPIRRLFALTHFKDIARAIAQIRRRIRNTKGKVFHEHDAVIKTFVRFGLAIEFSQCIERRSDGTDYYIYHLTKREK